MKFWLVPIRYPGDTFGYAELMVRDETRAGAVKKAATWCRTHSGTGLALGRQDVREWVEEIYLNQGSDY